MRWPDDSPRLRAAICSSAPLGAGDNQGREAHRIAWLTGLGQQNSWTYGAYGQKLTETDPVWSENSTVVFLRLLPAGAESACGYAPVLEGLRVCTGVVRAEWCPVELRAPSF